MAKGRWLIWGFIFSVVIFLAVYILIYKKVVDNPTAILMLGNMNISFLKGFLSDIKNVILSSLVLGFLLGAIPLIGSRKKENSNPFVQN
jgi:hypothetical protein